MEEGADGGADGLGVVQVDGGVGEDYGVGAAWASAQRSTVPAVPGVPDVGEDGDQLGPGGDDLLEGRVQEAADADDPLRGDGLGDLGEDGVGGVVDTGSGGERGLDDRGVPLGGLDGGEELDEGRFPARPAVLDGLTDGLRALGDEEAVLAPEVALGEPPGGDDARGTRGDQLGGDHEVRRFSLRVFEVFEGDGDFGADAPGPAGARACGSGQRYCGLEDQAAAFGALTSKPAEPSARPRPARRTR